MPNNTPDKDLNDLGFDTSKSRRNLFYIIFTTLLSIIFVLARQVNIERKATKIAEDERLKIQENLTNMQEKLYQRMFDIVTQELKEPKAQLNQAVSKVDSAALKVKNAAEKLNGKNKK